MSVIFFKKKKICYIILTAEKSKILTFFKFGKTLKNKWWIKYINNSYKRTKTYLKSKKQEKQYNLSQKNQKLLKLNFEIIKDINIYKLNF